MKSKIKSFTRLVILLIIFSSLFFNCQSDDSYTIEDESKNIFPYKITAISEKDIISNIKVNNKIRNLSTIKSNNINKDTHNETYDFIVLTDNVRLIESTDSYKHSYTLPIEREHPTDELENLVFTYIASIDDYESYIVTYHFSALQKQEFLMNGYIESSYHVSYEPIFTNFDDILSKDFMPVPCNTSFTVYHITPDTGETFHYETNGVVQNACEHENDDENGPCYAYTVIEIDCPDGGSAAGATHSTGSHTPSNASNNTSNAGSNSSSNSGNTNDDAPITTPTVRNSTLVLDISGLTLAINSWLNENIEIKIGLINLLEKNPGGDSFILEAIEALMADNSLTLENYLAMQIVLDAPDNPIEDINNYLSCFDTSQPAEFTIYVDQPRPGTRETWTITGGVGHGFIGIKQGNKERILGLYPVGIATPFNPDDPRVYGDDSVRHYDISISKNITAFQLWAIVTEITQTNTNYNLSTNNCSTFAIEIGQLAGISLPLTFGSWSGGHGNNPGDLGEDIRESNILGTTKNTDGGTAPNNSGN